MLVYTLLHCVQAIAKGAESLFLTVTQKVSVLGDVCQEGMKEMYADLVQLLAVAATRLREEVSQLRCLVYTVCVHCMLACPYVGEYARGGHFGGTDQEEERQ